MPSPSAADTARRLADLKAEVARDSAVRPPPPIAAASLPWRWEYLARRALAVLALLVLPFVLLVRGSVFLYTRHGFPTWIALLSAAGVMLLVVTAYAAWLAHRLTGRLRVTIVAQWVAAPLVLSFCAHALLFLARANAKGDQVQAEYRATHPLLRVALATLMLANNDLVVTDLRRVPADYARMGLPVFDGTLHARQPDGWAHAVDLRTIGRGAIVNLLVEWYFRAMGFRTLRHVGTADHLHVELPLH
jgi:hypothetical protein